MWRRHGSFIGQWWVIRFIRRRGWNTETKKKPGGPGAWYCSHSNFGGSCLGALHIEMGFHDFNGITVGCISCHKPPPLRETIKRLSVSHPGLRDADEFHQQYYLEWFVIMGPPLYWIAQYKYIYIHVYMCAYTCPPHIYNICMYVYVYIYNIHHRWISNWKVEVSVAKAQLKWWSTSPILVRYGQPIACFKSQGGLKPQFPPWKHQF